MKNHYFIGFALFVGSLLSGCTGMPEQVSPVSPFSLEQYQGKWYEIARLDHSFERGLENVTANYVINEDGSVTVLNRGFNAQDNEWSEAQGKAQFVASNNEGHLKVSFFGPFYSSYVVFGLDQQDYQYAYVSGYNTDYLWLLARTPQVSEQRIADFKAAAQQRGFNTEQLIMVMQSPTN
ncbi:lipocalin family protein [Pseudoalteromonas haloplanktis]|uniref:Outer membrane lipoprotein Blc n=1 Tax=Pseudoalteromonas haloplanktis TaxID=228 RepID=A0ABU1B8Y4_PSEHA|nr:lipocalin family protein [Pseudoalteromonas haloplanktis]MDQ9090256.1 lipocalin family protein [Pseudoalteromonas haloplanktis]